MFDKIKQAFAGPVKILEKNNVGCLAGERFDEQSPRVKDLVAVGARAPLTFASQCRQHVIGQMHSVISTVAALRNSKKRLRCLVAWKG